MEYRFFAACAKGVEEVLAGELHTIGVKSIETGTGGVYFTGDMTDCYRVNLWVRTATRVLLELTTFHAATPEALYHGAANIAWGDYFRFNQTFAVYASVRDSSITHSGFAALKVKDAIADTFRKTFGRRPNVDTSDPDVRVFIRIINDECVVNIDTSGESLHMRGYRKEKGKAPLRETLAAALLLIAGYDGNTVFRDFMCGSGTIAIEAALIALDVAPGLLRKRFGFQRLIHYNRKTWEKLLAEARSKRKRRAAHKIYASDISKEVIETAKSNARRAGVREVINISVKDFKDTYRQSDSGIIVTNPPYGERLNKNQKEKLIALHKDIGDTLKKNFTGYDAYILCGDLELVKKIGLKAAKKIVLFNGPIECRLLKYELYKGSRDARS